MESALLTLMHLCFLLQGIFISGIYSNDVPAKFEEKFKVETVRQGDSAALRCDVTGDQPISIVWYKDKRELEITELSRYEKFEIFQKNGVNSELFIRDVDRRDGALYSCIATNDYGSDERNIKFLVVEVPSQPLDVKVLDVWSRSATIRWSAPYSGNSPITRYKIQYWKHKHGPKTLNEDEISATQTTAVIQGLKPGTSYALAVVAENEIGHGEPSETIRFVTSEEEPSGPPTDLYVEARGPTSILVKWKPPPKECWNGELKGYFVGYKPEGTNRPYTFRIIESSTNESNEYLIIGLTKSARYSILVKAYNKAGAGPPSQELVIRTLDGGKENIQMSRFHQSTENGSLTFNFTSKEHEGSYECKIENGIGESLTKIVQLVVHVPARFDEKFTVVTVKKGDSASLRCEAVGDQTLLVIWRKDSKELRKINGGRYEIFETLTPKGLKSELVLREADRTDGHLYTCLTENPYGKDERSIKLLVMEVPSTPLDLKVQEVWSRSASVSWSSPYTGNSPITKYVLQYWREEVSGGRHRLEEKVVSSAQTSALIKDLYPGTSYGLAIVAENTVGRGEPSGTISFTTGEEEPSGPPVNVKVDVKGTASLLVTWKPPPKSEWNGKLKGYYVGYKIIQDSSPPYSFNTVDYAPGGIQEHMITSLKKDTEYSIIVKAFNNAGSGPPSHEIIVRTLGGDLPSPPIVFVVATSENSIKIQWRSTINKSPISGHAIHYRKKGEIWQRVAVTSPHENSHTLTGLHGGTFYQLYVTANSEFGEGDPSDLVTVKTYSPPHWIKQPEDVETIEGNRATLLCNAGGPPQPRITWKKIEYER